MDDLNAYLKECLVGKSQVQADFLIAVASCKVSGDEEKDKKSGDEKTATFYDSLNSEKIELLEVIGTATKIAFNFNRDALDILLGKKGNYSIIRKFHNQGTGKEDVAKALQQEIELTRSENELCLTSILV